MSKKNRIKGTYHEPETQMDTHRPKGPPRPREYESQEAQLESLPHGENKEVKRKIAYKTGWADWKEKTELVARREAEAREGLTRRVQRVLDNDKNLRSYDLNARTGHDEAEISGIVDTLSEAQHAAELVDQVPGVKGVVSDLTISTDGQITDADVTKEVREELNANPQVNLRHIGAESRGGTVILRGTTEDPDEIEAAKQAAGKARGVPRVLSQVKLKDAGDMSLEEIFHSQVRNDEGD